MCQRVFRNSRNLPCVCVDRHGIGKTNVVITSTHWNLVVGLVNTSSGYLNWSLEKSTVSQVVMHSLLVISSHSWIFCIHVYKSAEILFVLWGWTEDIRGVSTAQLCKLSRLRFPHASQLHQFVLCPFSCSCWVVWDFQYLILGWFFLGVVGVGGDTDDTSSIPSM